jgi:hypothetical protein
LDSRYLRSRAAISQSLTGLSPSLCFQIIGDGSAEFATAGTAHGKLGFSTCSLELACAKATTTYELIGRSALGLLQEPLRQRETRCEHDRVELCATRIRRSCTHRCAAQTRPLRSPAARPIFRRLLTPALCFRRGNVANPVRGCSVVHRFWPNWQRSLRSVHLPVSLLTRTFSCALQQPHTAAL